MSQWTDEELAGLTRDYDGTVRGLAKECLAHRKARIEAIKLIAAYRDDLAGEALGAVTSRAHRQWIADQIAACNRLLGAAP